MILETAINRPEIKMMYDKQVAYHISALHPMGESVYAFDCTFFRLFCLTAKALRRITMRDFLVGAIEPEKYTLIRVQLRFLG
jgi:hypothetical protein